MPSPEKSEVPQKRDSGPVKSTNGVSPQMESAVTVKAGVCGFSSRIVATSQDGQHVTFTIQTDCPNIRRLSEHLEQRAPIDAFRELATQADSQIQQCAAKTVSGCCLGCVVPAAVQKALQVATGLALPGDASITFADVE